MLAVDINNLPDDIDSLKSIVHNYHTHYELQREEIRLLLARLHGRTSEKRYFSPDEELQGRLFDEIDLHAEDDEAPTEPAGTPVKAHVRKKTGRKPLPESLERVIQEYDVPAEGLLCACGQMKTRIGSDVSERLDIIPAKIQVLRQIRHKYACRSCEGVNDTGESAAVTMAPVPPQMVPRSIAASGLIAYFLTSKFCDGIPFYRQEKQFSRIGVDLSRATMCNIAILTAGGCDRFIELMIEDLRSGPYLGIDETTLQVLNEAGRKNTATSYMWVVRGGTRGHPIVMFRYSPTRSTEAVSPLLEGYRGVIQSDGYGSYDVLAREEAFVHAGCMAHARRYFVDAMKASPGGAAQSFIDLIGQLYKIEADIREGNPAEERIKDLRKEKSVPVLEKIKERLDREVYHIAPKSKLGKAINYMRTQWPKLIVYLEYGFLPIDNNLVENAIRPFVVGRKNWLFSGSPRGATASAALYSIIETAKANGHEPYWYLRYLFEKLPAAKSDDEIHALLPSRLDAASVPRS
jgi:transposase